jgi:hypothetical protein
VLMGSDSSQAKRSDMYASIDDDRWLRPATKTLAMCDRVAARFDQSDIRGRQLER